MIFLYNKNVFQRGVSCQNKLESNSGELLCIKARKAKTRNFMQMYKVKTFKTSQCNL